MEGAKPWWQSAGVWGSVAAVAAGLLHLFGYTVSAADQAQLAQSFTNIANGISIFAGIGGGLLALWGRIRATKVVTR